MQIKRTKEKNYRILLYIIEYELNYIMKIENYRKKIKKNIEYRLKRSNIVIFDMAQNNKLSHVLIT